MNAGRFDRRLIVQTRTLSQDSLAGRVETWTDTANIWAERMPKSASETEAADSERQVATEQFRIRHMAIDATDNRIIYRAEVYQILGVTESGGRRAYLILETRKLSELQ
jgi:SPP1 family predicted phage head-tail adaptor